MEMFDKIWKEGNLQYIIKFNIYPEMDYLYLIDNLYLILET